MVIKLSKKEFLKHIDEDVFSVIEKEKNRLNDNIELIASENVVSRAVMDAVGSILTNKYAEGYPSARYYGGCIHVDSVEELALERLSKLFKCKENGYSCNVQPHSGSQANMAVYMAMLQPGERILGMDLSAGGHLTHGCKVNFSGKIYNHFSYGVDEKGYIDYDKVKEIAELVKPKIIVCGASAYPREIDFKKFKEIADSVNAYLMADIAHVAGLICAGIHPSPIPYADFITSTTHKTLRGTRGGVIIAKDEFIKKINSAIFPGIQGGPLMHIIAGKAVAFKEALKPDFKEYQEQIVANAKTMAKTLMAKGIDLVSGGTDNHLMLLDLRNLSITGKDAEKTLEDVGITVNKNGIPHDPLPPKITSGVRIGTPAITTRGFKESDCEALAEIMSNVLKNTSDKSILEKAKKDVQELCDKYPLFEDE